ncbi:muskelin-like [Bolinopsis microptera]|uniref:muskelin-like n=1 Tax=Bolinopsis microptera TaxID=2820187 RepID=UPI003079AE2C
MVGITEGLLPPNVTIGYSIHKWSSYAGDYHPSKILLDDPSDQMSRWQSGSNFPPQYLTLKLDRPSVIRKITFGKFHKSHVCNLKSFTILGGMSEEGMVELGKKGLTNNSKPETFDLDDAFHGNYFPSSYIKIVPDTTWGPAALNFSIWYVRLSGVSDPLYVNPCIQFFTNRRQERAIKLCLKHLRQHNYSEAFESLQKRTKVQLEHPMLTQLHEKLVGSGDFDEVEVLLDHAFHDGYMEDYTSKQYSAKWEQIHVPDGSPRPGNRGGHPMCIDETAGKVYLFGGWDGKNDLGDFWEYNSSANTWQCISADTEINSGPCRRSCHKMVLDSKHKLIYILGRYLDVRARVNMELKSDFYCYDIQCDQWNLISSDTGSEGGPSLIYDHQMVLDSDLQTIYIFGGKILNNSGIRSEAEYSGLYKYHIPSNVWTVLKPDNDLMLRSRFGHSMLYHPDKKQLFIFAGQREHFLDDFLVYNTHNDTVEEVMCVDETKVPESGFTMRATIDTQHQEIHMMSGLSKDHRNGSKDYTDAKTKIYVYSLKRNKWNEVGKNAGCTEPEPCPRFAHMLVYDSRKKLHYMFGGNPGAGNPMERGTDMDRRLDDFWCLRIKRPAFGDMKRALQFLVRKFKFRDMSLRDPVGALLYLQQHVEEVVDHSNKEEEHQFQELVVSVFDNSSQRDTYTIRTELFDVLMAYFPESMSQPKDNLTDYVPPV